MRHKMKAKNNAKLTFRNSSIFGAFYFKFSQLKEDSYSDN